MRNKFDEQLDRLNAELISMGNLIETAIANAVSGFRGESSEYLEHAKDIENEVNSKEKDIERLCLKLLLRQQPVARDLRLISSALKMITDMERIGDQAFDIAEITGIMDKTGIEAEPKHVSAMAKATITMVNNSVDAFVKKDLNLAGEVIKSDDYVDELFNISKREIAAMIAMNPAKPDTALDMLMIAKYFERIGDHATNIAEWVEFSIIGEHI